MNNENVEKLVKEIELLSMERASYYKLFVKKAEELKNLNKELIVCKRNNKDLSAEVRDIENANQIKKIIECEHERNKYAHLCVQLDIEIDNKKMELDKMIALKTNQKCKKIHVLNEQEEKIA